MCEDWELGALYRHYLPDNDKAFEKCRDKFLTQLLKKKNLHFMIGTHYRWKTPMIISVLYPKKDEEYSLFVLFGKIVIDKSFAVNYLFYEKDYWCCLWAC